MKPCRRRSGAMPAVDEERLADGARPGSVGDLPAAHVHDRLDPLRGPRLHVHRAVGEVQAVGRGAVRQHIELAAQIEVAPTTLWIVTSSGSETSDGRTPIFGAGASAPATTVMWPSSSSGLGGAAEEAGASRRSRGDGERGGGERHGAEGVSS